MAKKAKCDYNETIKWKIHQLTIENNGNYIIIEDGSCGPTIIALYGSQAKMVLDYLKQTDTKNLSEPDEEGDE